MQPVRTQEVPLGDGTRVRVHALRGRELRLLRLKAAVHERAAEGAALLTHLRGVPTRALALPSPHLRLAETPASLIDAGGVRYLTTRGALLGYLGRRRDGAAPEASAERFLQALVRRGSVAFSRETSGAVETLPWPVGTLGSLRQLSRLHPKAFALNSAFFLLDPRELDAPQAALGDVAGLQVSGGRVLNPATVPRATLLRDAAGWRIARVALADLTLTLADGTELRPTDPGLRWRYRGDGAPDPAPAALEVLLQGAAAVALYRGGGAPVPFGAVVLAFEELPPPTVLTALAERPWVRWRVNGPTVQSAIAAGPLLVQGGEVAIDAETLPAERFFTLGSADPTAPLVFPADHASTRAARIGVGIDAAGELLVVSVEGRSRLGAGDDRAPTGATLLELAELLVAAGAVSAMNLDGGGSTQIARGGGVIHPSSDRRGVAEALFDRPLPQLALLL